MTFSLHQGGVVMSSQIKHTHSHQDTHTRYIKCSTQQKQRETELEERQKRVKMEKRAGRKSSPKDLVVARTYLPPGSTLHEAVDELQN